MGTPIVPCSDYSGVVHFVGTGVTQWKVGDEVFGVRSLSRKQLPHTLNPSLPGLTQLSQPKEHSNNTSPFRPHHPCPADPPP